MKLKLTDDYSSFLSELKPTLAYTTMAQIWIRDLQNHIFSNALLRKPSIKLV